MGISKVSLDGNTLMDLSSVTVTEADLINNNTAHDNKGDVIVGEGKINQAKQVLGHTVSGEYINSGVTTIGGRAFSGGNTGLTRVFFPNVTLIRSYAFTDCASLTEISFPEVTTIGSYSFQNCSALVSASFPKLTSIPESGFNTCRKLKTLDIPNVTQIGHAGLQYCALTELVSTKLQGISSYGMRGSGSLKTVNIPNATWLSEQALASCAKITTYFVPRVSSLGAYQFNNGASDPLQKVAYPSLSSIGTDVFHNSKSITTLDFGIAMASIGNRSFQTSPKLATLIFRKPNTIVTLGYTNAFDDTPFKSGGTGGTIYIPKVLYDHLGDGSALDYQSATNWSTIYARGVITWAQIEGSEYEFNYADGVPCTGLYSNIINGATSSSPRWCPYGEPFTTIVTPDIGFEFTIVSVKMGGIDITETAYNSTTNTIYIESVTGYLIINATATPINYQWSYEWDYTDGLPVDNGWTESKWNSGATATMTGDGLKLESPNSTNICYLKNDYIMNSGVMEVTLSETFNTSTAYGNACIALSNGTSAIAFCSPKGQGAIRNNSSYASCTTIGYTIPSATDITVRLAIDGMKGNISIDGLVKWRTSDISTATYAGSGWALYTRFGSESQQSGNSTIIKSVRIKQLS